jgi:hypothetical protein
MKETQKIPIKTKLCLSHAIPEKIIENREGYLHSGESEMLPIAEEKISQIH